MDNRGFISTALVVSVSILAMILLLSIIRSFETNNFHAYNITRGARDRLTDAKNPNCSWGQTPFMKIHQTAAMEEAGIDAVATSAILLNCSHVDGINTHSIPTDDEISNNWITIKRYNENIAEWQILDNNSMAFNVEVANINTSGNEASILEIRIIFNLTSSLPGRYILVLERSSIYTFDEFGNIELTTREIVVE